MGNIKSKTCPVCWEHMLLHVIFECRCQKILPIEKEPEKLAGGPLSDNTDWATKTANQYEPHTTSILGQLIFQWTGEHKTDSTGLQEEAADLVE